MQKAGLILWVLLVIPLACDKNLPKVFRVLQNPYWNYLDNVWKVAGNLMDDCFATKGAKITGKIHG